MEGTATLFIVGRFYLITFMKVYVLIATYNDISDAIALSSNQRQLNSLSNKLNNMPSLAHFTVCEVPYLDANPIIAEHPINDLANSKMATNSRLEP